MNFSPFSSSLKALFFIFIACLFVYSNSLFNNFMLDDYMVLFGEKGVEGLNSVSSLFFSSHNQNTFYRPVGHIILVLFFKLFGHSFFYYHLANLLLFVCICFLVYAITHQLFHDIRLSFFTALFYAIHPIKGMLANYITANIISTF